MEISEKLRKYLNFWYSTCFQVKREAKSDSGCQAHKVLTFQYVIRKETAMFYDNYGWYGVEYDWDSLRKNRDFC